MGTGTGTGRGFVAHKYSSQRSSGNSILLPFVILLTVFICSVVLLNQKTHFLALSSSYRVQVTSLPDVVKIKVGNTYLNKGNPIRTPAMIKLKEDPSLITIEKEGYISRTLQATSTSNSVNVILSKKKRDTGIVDINVKQKKKVYIEYDRVLKRFTPVSLLNVDLNTQHSIQVYPYYPNKSVVFRCNFSLRNQRSKLMLDVDNRKCDLSE